MNDCGVRFIIQGLDINTSFKKKFFPTRFSMTNAKLFSCLIIRTAGHIN